MAKQKIFISSVQAEFAVKRKRLAEYIRQDALLSRYFEPFLFEELLAQDVSAQTAYLEQAAKSEVYLLLVGEQYGYQDADFMTILWRPEKEDAGNVTGNVAGSATDHVTDHVADHVTDHVTDHVKRLILAIRGDTKTRDEIMSCLGLKNRGNLRDSYIKPAVSAGYVAMLYPASPRRTDQAYYLTEKGLEMLKLISIKLVSHHEDADILWCSFDAPLVARR